MDMGMERVYWRHDSSRGVNSKVYGFIDSAHIQPNAKKLKGFMVQMDKDPIILQKQTLSLWR